MFRRLWNVFRQRKIAAEIRQEMDGHLALIEEEERAQGANAAGARRSARLRFGNQGVYEQQAREADLSVWLDDLVRDLQFGGRQLWRNPGFAAAGVLLLGLGIGVNAAIFTVIRSVILRPLPLEEPERLVSVIETSGRFETPESWPDLQDLQEGNHVFMASGGFSRAAFIFRGSGDALNVKGCRATPGYFAALKVEPTAGRLFDAGEGLEGGNAVALIREDFWRSALHADPEVLQKTILLNGRATQVVGILPAQFRFPASDTVVWTPLIPRGAEKSRGYHAFSLVGRLKPSITTGQAQADLQIIMQRLAREYPEQNARRSVKVFSFQDWSMDKGMRDRLIVLQAAALGLFLMACANVSSLLLARHSTRRREFDVRLALGASRGRQVRQHFAESLLLAMAGCAAATALGAAGVKFLVWLYADAMPRAAEIAPDWKLVGAVAAIAIGAGIVMGVAAMAHGRADVAGLSTAGGSRVTAERHGVWVRQMLVVFQLACAVVLFTSTFSVLLGFGRLLHEDVGFDRSHLLTMRVSLPSGKYKSGQEIGERFENLAARMRSIPGVREAAAVNQLPVKEWGINGNVNVEGLKADQRDFFAEYRWITKDYLRTMGIPLVRGRQLLPEEVTGGQKAAIVNQTMARKLWGERDPLGAHINMFNPEWITVVGIARDIRQSGLTVPPSAEVYMAAPTAAVNIPIWSVVVRSELPALSLMPAIRDAIRSEEREAAVDRVQTMDDAIAGTVSAQRIVASLLAAFAVLALLLASIGLYGLLAFTVAACMPELAIRAALGSTPGALIGRVGREGVSLIAAGLACGFVGMVPLHPILKRFVLDVAPLGPAVLAPVFTILALVGVTAVMIPARRAARIDPLRVLRAD